MILVDARCTIRPESRAGFTHEVTAIVPIVRKEPGCHRYELLADTADSGVFHFIEEWESHRHLDAHLNTPHMQEYFRKTAGFHARPAKMVIYDISESRTSTPGS